MSDPQSSNGVEIYKATLKFIRSLLGLAFMAWLAWLVVPRVGGFFRWVGSLDHTLLMTLAVALPAALVSIAGFSIYAVFFRGASFVERIVNGETAKAAVRMKVRIKDGEQVVEAGGSEPKPGA